MGNVLQFVGMNGNGKRQATSTGEKRKPKAQSEEPIVDIVKRFKEQDKTEPPPSATA